MNLPVRLTRRPFLFWGLGLGALKAALDAGVFLLFGEKWSLLIYVHPSRAPLFQPEGRWGLWFAMWALAVPFIVVGVKLTLARLRDANLPRGLVACFFLPFAHLLFLLLLTVVPSREPSPDAPALHEARVGLSTALAVASALGAIVFLTCMAFAVGLMKGYGIALFVGAPFLSGLSVVRILAELQPEAGRGRAVAATLLAMALSIAVFVAFALEGAVCILMASPLVGLLAVLGALAGHEAFRKPLPQGYAPALVIFPVLVLLDLRAPEPRERVVESEVIVAAPPERVWTQVIGFPELPPAREWIFKAGVAAPLRATIEGQGVGAMRRCEFSTGAFVEPVTTWLPGRELAFGVASQPDVLREFTLYPGPRPPHLDDYLRCSRGQFLLEPLPGGRTRLVGRTWYRLRMGPEPYWALWADGFIHRIHLRVLEHVARQTQLD